MAVRSGMKFWRGHGALLGAIVKNFHVGRGSRGGVCRERKDGVAASKNWKVKPSSPQVWNGYIPKKNRHSESVHYKGERRHLRRVLRGSGLGHFRWVGGGEPSSAQHCDTQATVTVSVTGPRVS